MGKCAARLFVVVCTWLLASPAYAEDRLIPGSITLDPTARCMGVRISFEGDDNLNASALVYYTVSGQERQAHPPLRIEPNPGQEEFATSLFWLSDDTRVQVRVVFHDPDGVAGPAELTASDYTLPLTWALPTLTLYVDPNGSDEGGTGSAAHPYASLQKALDTQPHDNKTVLLRPGVYRSREHQRYLALIRARNSHVWIGPDPAYPGEVILDGSLSEQEWETATWQPYSEGVYWRQPAEGLFSQSEQPGSVGYKPAGGMMLRCFWFRTLDELLSATDLPGYALHDGKLYLRLSDGFTPSGGEVVVSWQRRGLWVLGDDAQRAEGIVIDGLTIRYFGRVVPIYPDQPDSEWANSGIGIILSDAVGCIVQNCKLEFTGVGIKMSNSPATHCGNLIRHNWMYDTIGQARIEASYKYSDARRVDGVYVTGGSMSAMIYDNTFSGFLDTITASATNNTDVIGNVVDNCGADAVELDFPRSTPEAPNKGGINLRCLSNVLGRCGSGLASISCTGIPHGPVFMIGNELYLNTHNWIYPTGDTFPYGETESFKLHHTLPSPGWKLVYHNTAYAIDTPYDDRTSGVVGSSALGSGGAVYRTVALNNVFATGQYTCIYQQPVDDQTWLDYNCHWLQDVGNGNRLLIAWMHPDWRWAGYYYDPHGSEPRWEDFQEETGYEQHGLHADPQLANPGVDLRLSTDSPCVGQGVIIPGVNEHWYSGSAPDMGVLEFQRGQSDPPGGGLTVSAGPDRVIEPGSSVGLAGSASGGVPPYSYLWLPPNGLSNCYVLHPIASPQQTTTYTLRVTDAAYNFASDQATVYVSASMPIASVWPQQLNVSCLVGMVPEAEMITVANVGLGQLYYQFSTTAEWITVHPAHGPIGGLGASEQADHQVSFGSSSLGVGKHNAEIWVEPNDPDVDPELVAVELTVLPDDQQSFQPPEDSGGCGAGAASLLGLGMLGWSGLQIRRRLR